MTIKYRILKLEETAQVATGGITKIEIMFSDEDGQEYPLERWDLQAHITEFWDPVTATWQAQPYTRPDEL